MKLRALSALLLLLLPPAPARADDLVDLVQDLDLLGSEAKSWFDIPLPTCSHLGAGPGDPLLPRSTKRFVPKRDCAPLTIESVCAQADESVKRQGGWGFSKAQRKLRFMDQELRKRVFGHAYEFFRSIAASPEAADECCGRSVPSEEGSRSAGQCRATFASAQFQIVRGQDENSHIGHYAFRSWHSQGRVQISDASLLNCENEQCVEHLILHELGHACHDSIHPLTLALGDLSSQMERDLRARFETESAADCAVRALSLEAERFQGASLANWHAEALANLVFLRARKDPAHWAWLCKSVENKDHGPPRAYLACALREPAVRSGLCGP